MKDGKTESDQAFPPPLSPLDDAWVGGEEGLLWTGLRWRVLLSLATHGDQAVKHLLV